MHIITLQRLTTKSGYNLEAKVLTSLSAIPLSLAYIKIPYELAEVVSSEAPLCRTEFEPYMKQLNVCLSVRLTIFVPTLRRRK
jgi:hypothetical protein